MLIRHSKNIECSFQENKSKATLDQTKIIFENLSLLQKGIQINYAISKRSHASQELTDTSQKLKMRLLCQRKEVVPQKMWLIQNLYIPTRQKLVRGVRFLALI